MIILVFVFFLIISIFGITGRSIRRFDTRYDSFIESSSEGVHEKQQSSQDARRWSPHKEAGEQLLLAKLNG